MKNAILIVACLVAVCTPSVVAAQTGNDQPKSTAQVTAEQAQAKVEQAQAVKTKIDEAQTPRFTGALTNVQIEVNLTDQVGNQPPEKKTVSMIVASRSWGKIRSAASVMPPGEPPYGVELNVDVRPWVAIDGPGSIQLEMTLVYAPIRTGADPKEKRPTGINQSQTVILQSGKPLVISQAADAISDRKVIIEVKATVLK